MPPDSAPIPANVFVGRQGAILFAAKQKLSNKQVTDLSKICYDSTDSRDSRENAMQASSGSLGAGGDSAHATWLGEKLA
jgi:hypothetical protein